MSRIGKKPITIPEGVTVNLVSGRAEITGKDRTLVVAIHQKMKVEQESGVITVSRRGDDSLARSLHGLTRTLISNAIEGVSKGFQKDLEIIGVGYRAAVEDSILILKVGFSHEVKVEPRDGISFDVKKNVISVSGADKQMVGQTAAEIRNIRKPEPYKGKGIKYVGEKIIRKVGKAVKGAGA